MPAVRAAHGDDADQLIRLWEAVYGEAAAAPRWRAHARAWIDRNVHRPSVACVPVIEDGGEIVATATGSLELGVPNPHCPRGRAVRLANVVTVAQHRRKGYGTALVLHVVEWARSIDADRVDLSATSDGQRIYESVGFELTTAPRMKLQL